MSEPTYGTYIRLNFEERLPPEGATIEARIWQQIGEDEYEIETSQVLHAPSNWTYMLFTFQLTDGIKAVDYRIIEPPTLYGFVVTPNYVRADTGFTLQGHYVTLHPFWSNRYIFTTQQEDPNIIVGGVLPIDRTILEQLEELGIEVNINDPESIGLLQAIGGFGSWLWQALTGVGGTIGGIIGVIPTIVEGTITALRTHLSDLLNVAGEGYAGNMVATLEGIREGSPQWHEALLENTEAITEGFMDRFTGTTDPTRWIPEVPTPSNYIIRTLNMASEMIENTVLDDATGLVLEALSLGQIEGLSNMATKIQSLFGTTETVSTIRKYPIEMAMLVPYKHAVNTEYPTLLPTYTDLIEMVVKEVISLDDFKEVMLKQGYNETWSQRIWDKHYIAPSFGDVRTAYHRGAINYDELLAMMRLVDLDPRYNESVWLPNIPEIPPINELINQRVKEVIGNTTFTQGLSFHGYEPIWSQRIWDAHYIPPTLGDILTAYRRGIPVDIPEFDETTGRTTVRRVPRLSIDDVHQLMVLVDLDERYQDIFDTRLYRDPTIREARYMYETGAIDEARVRNIVERSGLAPDDIDNMTHYLTHFVERAFQRRYLTSLATAYMNQTYSNTEVIERVTKAGFTEGVANWIIEIGQVRRDIEATVPEEPKPRILTMSQLDKAYVRDLIDDTEYTSRMLTMGYETLDISLKLQILNMDKVVEEEGARVIRLTTSQLLNAWRYEEMTEDELRTELALRGLDELSIDRLVNSKKTQWGIGGET